MFTGNQICLGYQQVALHSRASVAESAHFIQSFVDGAAIDPFVLKALMGLCLLCFYRNLMLIQNLMHASSALASSNIINAALRCLAPACDCGPLSLDHIVGSHSTGLYKTAHDFFKR